MHEIESQVIALIRAAGIEVEIEPDDYGTELRQLGVDSLTFFDILEVIEEHTGRTLSDETAASIKSIRDLAQFMNGSS